MSIIKFVTGADMKKPIIGVTLDSEEAGGWSKLPWYAVRQNYCDSIAKAGGVPVTLPHQPEIVDEYLGFLSGLLVTGGNFDVDPAMFGATTRHTGFSPDIFGPKPPPYYGAHERPPHPV